MWTVVGNLNDPRINHTTTLLPNGKVLVAGGVNGNPSSSAELFDPATATWTMTGSMIDARFFHTATLLHSGKVLVAGGQGFNNNLSSAELYIRKWNLDSDRQHGGTKAGYHSDASGLRQGAAGRGRRWRAAV